MMRRVWIGGFIGILLATPLLLTQSCTQPEEGAADTLYVYRKDTVYQRDTLVIREPISGFDTISIDLFSYFEKYFWRRQYPMDSYDTTRRSDEAFTEAGNARLKNLEGRVIPGDDLKEPIIVYTIEPREFHAQVNIDTFYTWVGNQCTTWVSDTVSSKADSVKCWKKDFIPDSSGAIKTFQFESRYWPNYPNPTDTVAQGFYRWKSWSYMKVDSTTAGRIIIPDIRYVHGKGFEVSEFVSRLEGMDNGLVGRIRIRIVK